MFGFLLILIFYGIDARFCQKQLIFFSFFFSPCVEASVHLSCSLYELIAIYLCIIWYGHLSCFYLLLILNKAAMNYIGIYLWEHISTFFWCVNTLGRELLVCTVCMPSSLINADSVCKWLYSFTLLVAAYESLGCPISLPTNSHLVHNCNLLQFKRVFL